MLRPGKGKVSAAAVETVQTSKPAVDGSLNGATAEKVRAQDAQMWHCYIDRLQDSLQAQKMLIVTVVMRILHRAKLALDLEAACKQLLVISPHHRCPDRHC
jgi:hypothetical protein